MPALVYGLGEGGRNLPLEEDPGGMLAAAAVGYPGKHHATLSAGEGGCKVRSESACRCCALRDGGTKQSRLVSRRMPPNGVEHIPGHDMRPEVAGTCRFRASDVRMGQLRHGTPRDCEHEIASGTASIRTQPVMAWHRDREGHDRRKGIQARLASPSR